MLHRIKMHVIDMPLEIALVANRVLQKRRCRSARSPFGWRATGVSVFATPSVNRRLMRLKRVDRRSQGLPVIDEHPRGSIHQRDGEEKRPALDEITTVSDHASP
jgi:hypothetical protein